MQYSMGQRIAHYRRISGQPQYAVARAVGRSGAWLSLVEHDAFTPSSDALQKIAAALNVPVEALLREAGRVR